MTKQIIEKYTIKKRIIAGIKRFWKVIIPVIPILLDMIPKLNIPYKESLVVLLAGIIAMEKALQKDKTIK